MSGWAGEKKFKTRQAKQDKKWQGVSIFILRPEEHESKQKKLATHEPQRLYQFLGETEADQEGKIN